jgi:electron transfer flavoprotein alpha/beta subunit
MREGASTIVVLLRRLRAHPDGSPAADVIGACDAAALAAAVATGREVAVVAAGPEREDEALRFALHRGAGRAARVWGDGLAGVDYHGVARVLAAAARKLGAELILTGDMSEDEGQGAVGPAVAEVLGVPHLTGAVDLSLAPQAVLATRRERGLVRTLRLPLPAVIAVRASAAALPAPVDGVSGVDVWDLAALGIEQRELKHRDRCLGRPSPVRLHGKATLLSEPAELVARLRAEGLL